jgi:hypothetical protein
MQILHYVRTADSVQDDNQWGCRKTDKRDVPNGWSTIRNVCRVIVSSQVVTVVLP